MIHHIVVTTMMVVFSYMGIRMFRRAVASQELQEWTSKGSAGAYGSLSTPSHTIGDED